MFTSILTGASSGITLAEVMICLISAFGCGILTAFSYYRTMHASREFSVSLCILPCIVMMTILMVNGNLGIGVAIAGSFSLIRFRSVPGKSSDIAMIFMVMAAGLACGTGYVTFAILMTICMNALYLLLVKFRFFSSSGNYRYITITIPEDLNYANAFEDIFGQYTSSSSKVSVKTVQMGSLYELQYEVELKDASREKEFLDAIRTRNGNLTVRSAVHAPVSYQL